ncbi:NTP transferase domain-containing protein [Pseudokineococcus sp. 1T1Z-3]|uniref:NTP transferase domain-containing protein n=1 Tax=Pseudokineococcus sp. 1T1Z-3 TaxID=3132745 RepID=UPI0030A566C4
MLTGGDGDALGVVVPAGGGSRRLRRDKLAEDLGGRDVLSRTLDGVRQVAPRSPVVVVGPPGRAAQLAAAGHADVTVVREEPAGAGPAAAVLAGVRALVGAPGLVGVVPGDAPWAAAALPSLRTAVRDGVVAAVALAPDGRRQHLVLAARAQHLVRLDPADLVDAPARALLQSLAAHQVVEVPVAASALLDVDDDAGLAAARRLLDGVSATTDEPTGA